jgi:hypothetical protein
LAKNITKPINNVCVLDLSFNFIIEIIFFGTKFEKWNFLTNKQLQGRKQAKKNGRMLS